MPKRNAYIQFARYSAIIFILPSCILVGFLAGDYLDDRLGTAPWLTLLFFLLGTAAGFAQVYRLVERRK